MSKLLLVTLALATSGAACEGRGPLEDVAPLLESLGDPTRPAAALSLELYRLLDEKSRAKLSARAVAMEGVAGVKISPAELLQARGVGPGRRISKVELIERSEQTARLRLYFESLGVSAVEGGRLPLPPAEPIELTSVFENERWRIVLPELESALATTAIEGGR